MGSKTEGVEGADRAREGYGMWNIGNVGGGGTVPEERTTGIGRGSSNGGGRGMYMASGS